VDEQEVPVGEIDDIDIEVEGNKQGQAKQNQ